MGGTDNVVWLTYDEIAERLGIERESARQQVKRKRWARRPGNDGKVRIGLPEELLSTGTEGGTDPGPLQEHDLELPPVQTPEHVSAILEPLTRHIERLEAQLEAAVSRASDRDALASERDVLTVQVEALRAALAVSEKDRDRWHEAATQPPAPLPNGPWWKRIAR